LTERALLEAMLANDTEPVLDGDTIDTLLEDAKIRDRTGLYPDDNGYTTTYNLNVAAARGWRLKAARVAADYDLDVDGKGLNRSQMVDQFLTMASAYAKLVGPRYRRLDGRGLRRY
jgi:hypothetical protein